MAVGHLAVCATLTLLGLGAGCAHTPEPCAEPDRPSAEPAILLDGAPEVPAELKEAMRPYLDVRGAALRGISEDGETLLVTTRLGQTDQIHVVERPLGTRRQVTFGQDSVRSARLVPGRTDALVYVQDEGGDEQFQLFLTELGTGRTRRLTDGASRTSSWRISAEADSILFTSNSRNGRDMDLWQVPLEVSGEAVPPTLLLETEGHWSVLDQSEDGRLVLLQRFESIQRASLHLLDLETRVLKDISGALGGSGIRWANFSGRGREILALSDHDGDHVALWVGALPEPHGDSAPAWERVPTGRSWDIEAVSVGKSHGVAGLSFNVDGYSELHLLDLGTRALRPGPAVPKTIVTGMAFARDAYVLGLSLTGPTLAGDVMTWEPATDRLVRWTASETGGLDPAGFVAPTFFSYPGLGGLPISAFMFTPPGPGPHPVAIHIHGGPESQSRPWFSASTQFLVRVLGIAVIFPNVRGSSGYGKAFLAMDDGMKREDSVRDIGALLDWIDTRDALDSGRVAVMGRSYGGYMVLASLVHFGARLRAGIDVVGISDFITFLENTSPYRRDLRRAEYGDERDPAMRRHFEAISPLRHAHRIESALFVAHGSRDPRVPVGEALQVAEAVRASGREVWAMIATQEGHAFSRRESVDMLSWLSALFLDRHLRETGGSD